MSYAGPTEKDKIRALVLEAMDQALQEHFRKLFANWISDDLKQPERARNGARRALKIYREAVKLLEEANLDSEPEA